MDRTRRAILKQGFLVKSPPQDKIGAVRSPHTHTPIHPKLAYTYTCIQHISTAYAASDSCKARK